MGKALDHLPSQFRGSCTPNAAQTNINAILDALASLGIAHIHIADQARQLINTGQPEAVRFSGGSQPKTLRPPFACEARRS